MPEMTSRLIEAMGQSAPLPIISTGRLIDDLDQVLRFLDGALQDTTTDRDWQVLDHADPMGTIGQLAVCLDVLHAQLRQQGFRPPAIDYMTDPSAFMRENVSYLASIEGYVREPDVTIH